MLKPRISAVFGFNLAQLRGLTFTIQAGTLAVVLTASQAAPDRGIRAAMKTLYYGDNLQVLRDSIATESVDLIYLDPPFNSNATYNVRCWRVSRPQFPAA